ncbi:hypothetical protein BgiBS90_006067 [Biomphalaria glabrata]|nr:hypothetical protein BgiBS90_006067 [Biomphalaria glabrata]
MFSYLLFLALQKLFCREQEQLLYYCSAKMQDAYMLHDDNEATLCSEFSQYLTCVQDSQWTCPNMLIFTDPVFIYAVEAAQDIASTLCGSNVEAVHRVCSLSIVSRMVKYCYKLASQVQMDTSFQENCLINAQYLACVTWVNTSCLNSPVLRNYSIPLAIKSSRAFVRECEKRLGRSDFISTKLKDT